MRYPALSVITLISFFGTLSASVYAVDVPPPIEPPQVLDGGIAPPPVTPPAEATVLPAAPTIRPSAGSSLGEYVSVNCNSNSAFTINSCDACFDGGGVKVGTRITGLFDHWINLTTTPLTAYQDEQKTPNMVKFGATTWTTTPATEAGVWKYSSDVAWTSGPRPSFILSPGSKVRFMEADLNAGYTLEKTDKKNGELVGMLRIPVVSRVTNVQTATEGSPSTHYECVAYKLDAPVVQAPPPTTPTPVTPEPVTPTPEMTKTETGPETLVLIAAAFFIAFGLMFTLRKRV